MSDDALSTLAANMNSLINRDGGMYSSNQAAEKGSLGRVKRSTFDRLRNIDKDGATMVGIDKLEGVAKTFGVEVWQLFVPNLDLNNPPRLAEGEMKALPLEGVDLNKLSTLDATKRAQLEGAILYAAAQLGIDIKKDG